MYQSRGRDQRIQWWADTWLELRSLRNRLTHEYDLNSDAFPELMGLVRQSRPTLATAVARFTDLCEQLRLT